MLLLEHHNFYLFRVDITNLIAKVETCTPAFFYCLILIDHLNLVFLKKLLYLQINNIYLLIF